MTAAIWVTRRLQSHQRDHSSGLFESHLTSGAETALSEDHPALIPVSDPEASERPAWSEALTDVALHARVSGAPPTGSRTESSQMAGEASRRRPMVPTGKQVENQGPRKRSWSAQPPEAAAREA